MNVCGRGGGTYAAFFFLLRRTLLLESYQRKYLEGCSSLGGEVA